MFCSGWQCFVADGRDKKVVLCSRWQGQKGSVFVVDGRDKKVVFCSGWQGQKGSVL